MNSVFFYNENTNSYFAYRSNSNGTNMTVRFVPDKGNIFDIELKQQDFINLLQESEIVNDENDLARLYLLDFTEAIENA